MNRVVAVLLVVLAAGSSLVFSAEEERKGYVKPELRDAVQITNRMLAPVRFAPQEMWYNGIIQDPRHGEYKMGYMLMKIEPDGHGNLVLTQKTRFVLKYYSVDYNTAESVYTEKISMDTGRIQEISIKGRATGYTYWAIGSSMPLESSADIDKKAVFDWNRKQVVVTYGDSPKAPVRTYDIEENAVAPSTLLLFIMKRMGRQDNRVHHYRFFSLHREKFLDAYFKYDGTKGKDVHKYSTVPQGWGDTWINSYWFGPPTDLAPNGMFQKIVANPTTTRYTTFRPTTKEDALAPVSALME